jgi:hypothetical protein
VDLPTAYSVGKAAQEESIEAILWRFFHLSEWIPSYYFV